MNVVYAALLLNLAYHQTSADELPRDRQTYYCGPGTLILTYHGQHGSDVTVVDWRQRTFELSRDFSEKGRVFANKDQRASLQVSGSTASFTVIDRNVDCVKSRRD